ncbi:MAG: cyclodeaminase/cyclohydrolase family protein, partial [Bacteroidota bacterium]
MATKKSLNGFLDELASSSPAPGGGSVAALAGALGAALTSMVCNLTIGKKKYAGVEEDMKKILKESEELRARFTLLIDQDADAFNKVMEAFSLPKDDESQQALRDAAITAATKEATMVPLEVMKHCIDALALAQNIAANGNKNSVSDAGVSALMLHAACESAALNVRINLNALSDSE